MSGATTASGSGNIGTYVFPSGTTSVTYTATDAAGNNAACTFNVIVTSNLSGFISGTATVSQNNSSTSNITFSGSGGVKPYTFTYNVNGGSNQTVVTSGSNSLVTVPQSNAVEGTFIYTLVSMTDANGCSSTIPADNKDTIKVLNSVNGTNLSPLIVMANSNFSNTVLDQPTQFKITNLGATASSGPITFYVAKPTSSGSSITFSSPGWTATVSGPLYVVTSNTAVINPNFGSVTVNATVHLDASVASGKKSLQMTLDSNTGGDNTPNNNSKSFSISKSN